MVFPKKLARDSVMCVVLAFALVGAAVEPPAMPQRAIAPDKTPPAGRKIPLADGEVKFTLFVPDAW
ncbi:MAG TPA: hypothetical protein VK850_19175, partial [Candidatus Binatia bacterium]|nr:hypothetical protein [Candidatus Binatia bacterium]